MDVNVDLLNTISDTIDNVAPVKEIGIRNCTQDWFNNETAKAIQIREKFLKKFKKKSIFRLTIIFYNAAKYNPQEVIKENKMEFFKYEIN